MDGQNIGGIRQLQISARFSYHDIGQLQEESVGKQRVCVEVGEKHAFCGGLRSFSHFFRLLLSIGIKLGVRKTNLPPRRVSTTLSSLVCHVARLLISQCQSRDAVRF